LKKKKSIEREKERKQITPSFLPHHLDRRHFEAKISLYLNDLHALVHELTHSNHFYPISNEKNEKERKRKKERKTYFAMNI
jgi:hypothetical protein